MFIDRITIKVEAGHGGKGSSSFRREKFVPKGGPDGGDGGCGGDVILQATIGEQSLVDLKFKSEWKAVRGGDGGSRQKHGANAESCRIKVPVGTLIFDHDSGEFLCDLKEDALEYVAVRGGKGGKGNLHYVTPVNRAPRMFQPGEEGELKKLDLELKIVADVGLVGFPNAGKSTFLNAVSEAHPKTASYPFTTLNPNVGVIETDDYRRFTIADIPGLISGAHQNIGLGHAFLRHIERCRIFCYVLDMGGTDGRDPLQDLAVLREELEHYETGLSKRPALILANKIDLSEATENLQRLQEIETETAILPVCAELAQNTGKAILALREMLDQIPQEDEQALLRILAKRRASAERKHQDADFETEF
ncbi:MAG: GTPase ObgE [Lentisphaeria bacterium]